MIRKSVRDQSRVTLASASAKKRHKHVESLTKEKPLTQQEAFFRERILATCGVQDFEYESEKLRVLTPAPSFRHPNLTPAERDSLTSHDQVQAYHKNKAALSFCARLPQAWAFCMLGGDEAAAQVPCPQQRMRALLAAVKVKAGPEGANLRKGERSMHELIAYAHKHAIPNGGLPASALLVSTIIAQVSDLASRAGKGSQGGASVGPSVREGFQFLREHLNLPIDIDSVVAEGEAPKMKKIENPRAAATLPIKVYCHFEHIAHLKEGTVNKYVQTYARIFLAGSLCSRLRMVDVLRSHFVEPRAEHEAEWLRMKDGTRIPPIITSARLFQRTVHPSRCASRLRVS